MESELLERVERWAKESPTKTMLTFVDDRGNATASLTCADLHRKMQNLAALLLASPAQHPKGLGVKAGDRVLLVYPPGLDFIVAFLACLRAGVVAVPVYPPDPRKMKKDISMFVAVAKSCNARIALTCQMYYHVKKIAGIKQKLTFSEQLPWPEHLQWVVVNDELIDHHSDKTKSMWLQPTDTPHASDVAFLQYTSGSTSAPKGVMLTHGNLTHNLRTISSALVASKDTVVVSWLPQYHDMGLIGAYLGTIFNGGKGVYMSPFSFIKDPTLWIKMISKYKATHLQAPNFAYSLCARKADKLREDSSNPPVDLSCVRHMINGAEPIQGDVLDAFYKAFTPYGLPLDVVKPTYGLAEHTVYVCGGGSQRLWVDKQALEHENTFTPIGNSSNSKAQGKEMIGCGVPSFRDHGIDVKIVDPETFWEQEEGTVGEIWISSASKALGYYGAELKELSQQMFHAKITSSTQTSAEEEEVGDGDVVPQAQREYLRTGDYGVLFNKELFICGRMKDLVIIRGRNHYPQDLEATAETHDELRPGCSAAFGFHDGSDDASNGDGEKLALVAELRDPEIKHKASLCGKIRSAIAKEHGVKVTLIVLVKPRSIPKTTSGKISRVRAKRALEEKQLEVLYRNEDFIGDAPDAEEDGQDPSLQAGEGGANGGAGARGGEVVGEMEMDRRVIVDAASAATTENQKDAGSSRSGDKVGSSSIVTDEPPEKVFDFLLAELAQLLGVDPKVLNASMPLQEMGMDSMALTQLQGIITQKYHIHVPEELLYHENTSLAMLHSALCGDKSASATTADPNTRLVGGPRAGEIGGARKRKEQKLVCGCIAC